MIYRLKPYDELFKDGLIYKTDYSGVTFSNGGISQSWMTLSPDCFEITYKIGHNLTTETYEAFSKLFTVINNEGNVMTVENNKSDTKQETPLNCDTKKTKKPQRYDLNEVMPEKENHPKPEKIVD